MVELAEGYTWVVVVMNILSGVNEANLDLLEDVGGERCANAMYCVSSLVHLALVTLFAYNGDCDRFLAIEAFLLFLDALMSYMMWWYEPFERGLFARPALFTDAELVRHLLKTELPLLLGGVLAYAE